MPTVSFYVCLLSFAVPNRIPITVQGTYVPTDSFSAE
jgi:hypothetical protein